MLRKALIFAVTLAFSPLGAAQKWIDEKGKVYYGEPPKGIKVKPAAMTGGGIGTSSTEDLERRLNEQAAAKSKSAGKSGKAVEYFPDRQRASRDPSQR